jgi:hypothetical protein
MIAAALAGPPTARAATVSQSSRLERGRCEASRTCLTIVTTRLDAGPGEVNHVRIVDDRRYGEPSGDTETMRFTDTGSAPLLAGPGCTAQPDGGVLCTFEANPPEDDSPDAPEPPDGTFQRGILRVHLGDGDDTLRLVGTDGHRLASVGYDTLFDGGAGDDRIDACETMRGGEGDDHLQGGPGVDTLEGGAGDDHLAGQSGDDFLRGGPGADVLRGGSFSDDLRGGSGDDRLDAGPGFDDVRGEAGDDRLDGGPSPDHLFGGSGDDRLFGGVDHRHDDLHGGPGLDRARRGRGGDTYVEIERIL